MSAALATGNNRLCDWNEPILVHIYGRGVLTVQGLPTGYYFIPVYNISTLF